MGLILGGNWNGYGQVMRFFREPFAVGKVQV